MQFQLRPCLLTLRAVGAAGIESAGVIGLFLILKHLRHHPLVVIPHREDRREQQVGIRMGGVVQNIRRFAHLHTAPAVHDGDALAERTDQAQVVGDEEEGHVQLLPQFFEQVDDLRLDRYVQGTGRLVTDEHLGVHGDGLGDGGALALAAGELMGKPVGVVGLEPDAGDQVDDVLVAPLLGADVEVVQHLPDAGADLPAGVEGTHRILKDHLNIVVGLPQLFAPDLGDILALQKHLARVDGEQVGDELGQGALAAARLAHHAEHLTGIHVVGGDHALDIVGIGFADIANFQNRLLTHTVTAPFNT